MSNFILRALEYGVLGLCAITLCLVWRIIDAEGKREGEPRKGMLGACYVFMGFCLSLVVLNVFVQLQERIPPPPCPECTSNVMTKKLSGGPGSLAAQAEGLYFGSCPDGFSAFGVTQGVTQFEYVRISSISGGRLEAYILHGGGRGRPPISPQSEVLCVEAGGRITFNEYADK